MIRNPQYPDVNVQPLANAPNYYKLSKGDREFVVQAQSQAEINLFTRSISTNTSARLPHYDASGLLTEVVFDPRQITETKQNISSVNTLIKTEQTTGLQYNPISGTWYDMTNVRLGSDEPTVITESQARLLLQAKGLDSDLIQQQQQLSQVWVNPSLYNLSSQNLNSTINIPSNLGPGQADQPPASVVRITPLFADPPSEAVTSPVVEQPTVFSTPNVVEPLVDDAPVIDTGVFIFQPSADTTASPPAPTPPNIKSQVTSVEEPRQAEVRSTTDQPRVSTATTSEFDESIAESTREIIINAPGPGTAGDVQIARNSNTASQSPFPRAMDWRLRISLAPQANYLYKVATPNDLLYPLVKTDGVIFPYTPTLDINYNANYDSTVITHSNYRAYNYTGSSVDNIMITGDFTAQDTVEANYLLAVIHFFRSVTKMFYGQDNSPIRGTPPPLCYLTGFGTYALDNHPVAVTSFNLRYPNDVDYINAGPGLGGTNALFSGISNNRLRSAGLISGGLPKPVVFNQGANSEKNTRVPTKLSIQISCIPIVTRNNISNQFSLQKYATGELLRGSKNPRGGGIW